MRIRRLLLALSAFAFVSLASAPVAAQTPSDGIWSGPTARTLPQGRMERGIFQPLRWGATDRIELSAYPIAEFVIPNARAKIRWHDEAGSTFSTIHSLAYPTPLLNLLAREGTGGILPATSDIPPMLSIRNGVAMTHALGGGHLATTDFLVATTPRFRAADFPTIDMPIVYPRTAGYHTAATFRMGVDVTGPIAGDFSYRAGLDGFVLPGMAGRAIVEQTGRVAWSPGPNLRAMIGYLFAAGEYPFGLQWNIYPILDLQFAWQLGGGG